MRPLALLPLAFKQLVRHRLRTLLTVLGVAAGMFLLTAVETMQRSLAAATETTAADTTLVVYRENRFCPATSRLPEHYADDIRGIAGVREVVPVQVVVNNCGASLDVIAFRGVPDGLLLKYAPEIAIIEGDLSLWEKRDDGALLGEQFARRRGLSVGDTFDAVGLTKDDPLLGERLKLWGRHGVAVGLNVSPRIVAVQVKDVGALHASLTVSIASRDCNTWKDFGIYRSAFTSLRGRWRP